MSDMGSLSDLFAAGADVYHESPTVVVSKTSKTLKTPKTPKTPRYAQALEYRNRTILPFLLISVEFYT